MAGIFAFISYLAVGLLCARIVLWDKSPLLRVWLGLSFGILLFMWLPVLAAFFVRFTNQAQNLALIYLLVLTLCACLWLFKHPKPDRAMDASDRKMLWALVCFVLPLTILSAYLQHTHTIRPVDGTLHVGQSTYGDLCMHLSIITGLRGSPLPADYNILPGTVMGYPLLTDAMSSSLLLLGVPLRWTIILPGTVMSALVYCGYLLMAREMTGKTSAALIAGLLLFLNGGLGFFYNFDLSSGSTAKIQEIFDGFYKTPANLPDLNLRWSNLVVDLLLPQRTFLGGWTIVLPALYFAREAFGKCELRMFLLAALFGAALPLLHAHSFVSLALYSAGAFVYFFYALPKGKRRALLAYTGLYLGIVLALAMPQLLAFTFRQATKEGFMRPHIGWVNTVNGENIDFPIWFWLKNVGLPLITMGFALLEWKKRDRADFIGAALIFIVAYTFSFQPLDYDNNKLFYIWFLLMLPSASAWCVSLWQRMKGMRARALLAAVFLVGSTLSGALSIARETMPQADYQLFSKEETEAGAFIDQNTPRDAMFITGFHHNNPVYALAGRDVVCGPDLFLYFHGLDYRGRKSQVEAFYADPWANLHILDDYGVDYIVVGDAERRQINIDEPALQSLFDVFYTNGGFTIYAAGEDFSPAGRTLPQEP